MMDYLVGAIVVTGCVLVVALFLAMVWSHMFR